MTEHQLEQIHRYTKFKVVETLIKKHQEGNTLNSIEEVEDVADDILQVLAICGLKFYRRGNKKI